jgi:hypothetical protein
MRVFLARKNIYLSKTTIHKYMNKQLGLKSIVRRKKQGYVKGTRIRYFLIFYIKILPLNQRIANGVPISRTYF